MLLRSILLDSLKYCQYSAWISFPWQPL